MGGVPGYNVCPLSCPSLPSLRFGSGFHILHTRTSPAPIYKARSITTPVHRLGSLAIVITFRIDEISLQRIQMGVGLVFPAHTLRFPHSPYPEGGPEIDMCTPMGVCTGVPP